MKREWRESIRSRPAKFQSHIHVHKFISNSFEFQSSMVVLVSPNKEIILVNNKSNLLKTLIQFHSYVSINKTNQMYQNKINKGYLLLSNKMIDNIHRKYSESLKYK